MSSDRFLGGFFLFNFSLTTKKAILPTLKLQLLFFLVGLQHNHSLKLYIIMDDSSDSSEELSPEQIKLEQDRLGEEFKELAKQFNQARASRAGDVLQALKRGRKVGLYSKIFDKQQEIFNQQKALAKRNRKYQTKMIRKVIYGEVHNIWIKYFDAKNSLQQELIKKANQQLLKLEQEYSGLKKPNINVEKIIIRQTQWANSITVPQVSGLSDEQITTDLRMIRSGKVETSDESDIEQQRQEQEQEEEEEEEVETLEEIIKPEPIKTVSPQLVQPQLPPPPPPLPPPPPPTLQLQPEQQQQQQQQMPDYYRYAEPTYQYPYYHQYPMQVPQYNYAPQAYGYYYDRQYYAYPYNQMYQMPYYGYMHPPPQR